MSKSPTLPTPPILPAPVPAWLAARQDRRSGDPEGGPGRNDGPDSCGRAAFRAGAALAHLHPIAMARIEAVPVLLLRDRMALGAAVAGIVRTGGRARAGELRDRAGFLRPGDRMDPDTAMFDLWRRAGAASLRGDALAQILAEASPHEEAQDAEGAAGREAASGRSATVEAGADGIERVPPEAGLGTHSGPEPDADPVSHAAEVLDRARAARPCQETVALLHADAALARELGWPRLLPLLATGLSRRDLALEGCALRHACHLAVAREAVHAARLAADLARRADRLRRVAPRLRAKAADAAVALFLARDVVAPTLDLAPTVRGSRVPMSPRAAARLCDRLVELGVVREMTGRATFRLYGL